MTSKKKRLHFYLECYFCKIKAHTAILRRHLHILPKFPHRFCPDFHQIKVLGVHLHPTTYTSVEKYCMTLMEIQLKYVGFMAPLAKKVPNP